MARHLREAPSGIRVLHIDDNEDELMFTKLYLENIEPTLSITSTASPIEALELLRRDAYDCVLCDYRMEELDGLRFNEIKRQVRDIPSILYTGKGSEEVAEQAFKSGFSDYLRKELDSGQFWVLVNRIKLCVEKHRAEREVAAHREYLEKVLDAVPAGVLVVDSENRRVVDVNQRAAALLWKPADAIVGLEAEAVLPGYTGDPGPYGDRLRRETLRSGDGRELPVTVQTRRIRVDGVEYVVESFVDAAQGVAAGPMGETG